MEQKRDLRVEKTYTALIAAFEQLLEEKSFEKITVKELCDRAKTRTATFYAHFADKYDFFAFMVKEIRLDFFRCAERSRDSENESEYYEALIRSVFDFLEKNQKLAQSIQNDPLLMTMLQAGSEDTTEAIERRIAVDMKRATSVDTKTAVQFLLGGINQVSAAWFVSPKRQDKEKVIADTTGLLKRVMGL